jgi:hypothetical protein
LDEVSVDATAAAILEKAIALDPIISLVLTF